MIDKLGEWVLRQACEAAVRTGLPWVAVNVSPAQFRHQSLDDLVFMVLDSCGLTPDRLQLEITEGVVLENASKSEAVLRRLRENGVRIALDDFGTGYSSINFLRRYGVHKLKIDRSFIQELGTSGEADAIVKAMITLASSMGIDVTAEGVETPEQRDHLAALGCQELQGYLFSRPIAEADLAILLATREGQEQSSTSRDVRRNA